MIEIRWEGIFVQPMRLHIESLCQHGANTDFMRTLYDLLMHGY